MGWVFGMDSFLGKKASNYYYGIPFSMGETVKLFVPS
jgi:hypothetical protein